MNQINSQNVKEENIFTLIPRLWAYLLKNFWE